MNIAFTVNPMGFDGLGATLISLLRHCSNTKEIDLWFLCADWTDFHRERTASLLAAEGHKGGVNFIDFDAGKEFGHLRSLHGDWSSYGRLLIPDRINSDVVLYLDSDLVVLIDVLQLNKFEFDGHFLAAAGGGQVQYSLERDFLMNTLGIGAKTAYFNAGVLLINLVEWKRQGIQEKWKKVAAAYPDKLSAVDQTLLNAVCKGNFARLPTRFNNAWYPGGAEPTDAKNSIIHFVGSPKPWDLFGKMLHKGYYVWKMYSSEAWDRDFNRLGRKKLVRAWRIKKSILKKMKEKILSRQ